MNTIHQQNNSDRLLGVIRLPIQLPKTVGRGCSGSVCSLPITETDLFARGPSHGYHRFHSLKRGIISASECFRLMDLYDVSFFLSTMWVGPFWFGMLVFPEHKLTQKAMEGPWFFLGPILIWWAATLAEPQGLIDFAKDSTNPAGVLEGLAAVMGTKPGASAAWAHMVAGDIFVTRWMWMRCGQEKISRGVTAAIVFFGVMLMPVGVAIYLAFVRSTSVPE